MLRSPIFRRIAAIVAALMLLSAPQLVPVTAADGISAAKPPPGLKTSCADLRRIQLKKCAPFVLFDTMPGDDFDFTGVRFATTPGWIPTLDEDQDEAEGFETATENVLLDSLDLALWYNTGVNALDVYLVADRPVPSGSSWLSEPDDTMVLEHWLLVNQAQPRTTPSAALVHVPSVIHPKLSAGTRYWIYISVPGAASAIGWFSGSSTFSGTAWFAERNSATGFTWWGADVTGFATRVTALH